MSFSFLRQPAPAIPYNDPPAGEEAKKPTQAVNSTQESVTSIPPTYSSSASVPNAYPIAPAATPDYQYAQAYYPQPVGAPQSAPYGYPQQQLNPIPHMLAPTSTLPVSTAHTYAQQAPAASISINQAFQPPVSSAQFYAQPGGPSQNPAFHTANTVPIMSLQSAQSSPLPSVAPVAAVDPTVAIALELSQSIPSLKPTPPPNSSPQVLEAWKFYIREIKDAQNANTRETRDAQVQHDREVKDATSANKINTFYDVGMGYGLSMTSMVHKVTSFGADRYRYNQKLESAKRNYDIRVEAAARALNDRVESANRSYEDALARL